jgi:hypothetical protein
VLAVWVIAGCVSLVSPPSWAQPRAHGPSADDAEAQHAQGNRLREQGRHAEARDLFRALYERTHDAKALVRQGLAEMALSEWVPADEHLTVGLAAQGNRWVDENRARIQGALREVQTHVGSLAIECAPEGAAVFVNDVQRARCPVAAPLRLPVGPVSVRVEAAGAAPVTRSAAVTAGEPTVVRVALTQAPPPVDTTALDAARATNRRRRTMLTLGGVSLGLGVAGLGVGVAGLLITNDAGTPRQPGLAIAGFAAGSVLAVTGVVLLVVAPARAREAASRGLCVPTVDRPGLACAWSF